ncbi:MAG: cupredoxin domain-containing protein [Acidimicrobiales bacterium]
MAREGAWRRLAVAAVVAVVAVTGLSACGGGDDDSGTQLPGEVETTDRLRFDPDEFTVRFDRETSFALVNEDNVDHNFTLTHVFVDADNFVTVDVKAGQTADVTFTVKERPASGTFTFYCRFHQAQGMSGKITVR